MVKGSPLVVIEFNGSTIRVCRSVVRRFDRMITHCFSFESAESEEETAKLITCHIKARHLRPENVTLSLPRYIAMSRLLRLPSEDKKEVAAMVALRIRRESCCEQEDDIVYDHKLVSFEKGGHALVSVFCVHKNKLMRYVRILKRSGILPHCVTLNIQGLLRWSPGNPKSAFLLNVDQNTLDFNVAFSGHSVFSRSLEFPKEGLAKEIKIGFELCRRALRPELEPEEKLYITGLTDVLTSADLKEWVSHPVERLVLNNAPPDADVSYASVIGLALAGAQEGIDLTPRELQLQVGRRRDRRFAYKTTALIFSALLILASFLCLSVDRTIQRIEAAKNELKTFLPVEKAFREKAILDFIDTQILKDRLLLDIYYGLTSLTPASVFLTDLEIGKDRDVVLEGFSADTTPVLQYLKNLENSPIFKNCRLDYMEDRHRGPHEGIKFKITCRAEVR